MTKFTVETADGYTDIEADSFKVDPDGCLVLTRTDETTERIAMFAPGGWLSVVKEGHDVTKDDERPQSKPASITYEIHGSPATTAVSNLDERIAEAMRRL